MRCHAHYHTSGGEKQGTGPGQSIFRFRLERKKGTGPFLELSAQKRTCPTCPLLYLSQRAAGLREFEIEDSDGNRIVVSGPIPGEQDADDCDPQETGSTSGRPDRIQIRYAMR